MREIRPLEGLGDVGRGRVQPEPGFGKQPVARRKMGLQNQPGVGFFRPHLRWGICWLARVRLDLTEGLC